MTIKTKYDIGDEVWYNTAGIQRKGVIVKIQCVISVHLAYNLYKLDNHFFYDEEDLSPVKE